MTDKQIIIDGVDVSECEFLIISDDKHLCRCIKSDLFGGIEFVENAKNGNCKDNDNCYYKQLARKAQSEKKLVEQIQTICDFINNRPEIFKGIYGGVDKIITEYTERKEQECEALQMSENEAGEIIAELKAECERLKHDNAYEVGVLEKTIDNLKVENEELKREKRNFYNFLTNKYNYGSFRPMWGTYLLRRFFKEDLGDFFDEAAYEMADTIEEKEKQIDKYSQALADIKEIAEKVYNDCDNCYRDTDTNCEIDCIDCTLGGKASLAKQILQKISECEVE